MTISIGQTLGPYRITEQLGQGGMATVYRAYHANLDRYVAIKILHPAFKEDPGFLERFKREAQIVARLEHPNIVPVYDYADFEGQPYLVMKYIEGETLKARLRRQPLSLTEAIGILDTVASALTYAHQQGILHRDIKPSNIMLDRHSTPTIADFGLARIAQAGESTLSQDMMLGTPQYISPEQAKGLRDLGPGTDIYSLGVLIYEIVVGRVPFNADTPYAIIHDHIYKPLPLPTQINPQVPPDVERVLLRALAKEPEARYASAVEMVAAFRSAVQDAHMTELTASYYRPLEGVSPSAATLPPGSLSSAPAPAYPVIPSPVSQSTPGTMSREAYRRRANLWMLSGIGTLLFTLIASLFIIVNAVAQVDSTSGDEPTANSAILVLPQSPGELPDLVLQFGETSLADAEALVESDPQNPVAHIYLAMAQLDSGDRDGALESMNYAITVLDAPADVLVRAARHVAALDAPDMASAIYLEAMARPDVPPEARNEAGSYVYAQIKAEPLRMREITASAVERNMQDSAVYLTMHALALLEAGRAPALVQANTAIEQALAMDDHLAETYFARALYYQAVGQSDAAQADLRQALSLPDTPAWVLDEANTRLTQRQTGT